MNYNFAMQIEYLLEIGVRPRLPSIFAKLHTARRAENFSGTEQKLGVRAETNLSKNPDTEPITNITWPVKRSKIRVASNVGVL